MFRAGFFGGQELPKTPVYKAAKHGDAETLKQLLQTPEGRKQVNQLCIIGWGPVHEASMRVHTESTVAFIFLDFIVEIAK
jgi:hypothetical protein